MVEKKCYGWKLGVKSIRKEKKRRNMVEFQN